MNDQRLAANLRAIHTDPSTFPDPDAVYRQILSIAIEQTPQQRGWLPPFPYWRFQPMFSATKFVVAGVIVALVGGFLLSGVLTQPSEEVAPAATSVGPGTFSPTGSLAQPRASHTATLLFDGRVLVVGGFDVWENGTSTAEVWDPDTDTFSPTGSLAERRVSHSATLLPDGRVLVVGGHCGSDPGCDSGIGSAEVWDPSTGAFSPAGSTAIRDLGLITLLPDGRVLVAGGDDCCSEGAEVWDPATSTFSPIDAVPAWGRAITLADGRVLIISDEDPYEHAYPASAEVWDPVTDTLSPAGSSALGRILSSTLLADGRVLFLGEYSSRDEEMTSAEVWDPATSTFSPAGSFLGASRGMNTVTPLTDGRALIAGGCTYYQVCSKAFDSAEVWDPATETFDVTGSPAVTRMRHTATALPDGRVLVVGGMLYFNLGGTVFASAEIWEPGPSGEPQHADIVAPVEVTGRATEDGCSGTEHKGPFEDSGAHAALFTCSTDTGSRWSFSDPRLEGAVRRIVEEVTFDLGDVSDVYVATTAFSIENDGGSWRERPRTWLLPDGIDTYDWLPQEVFVLEGSGDYEGLVAVLRVTGPNEVFRGSIIDARWMPPPPENALTE